MSRYFRDFEVNVSLEISKPWFLTWNIAKQNILSTMLAPPVTTPCLAKEAWPRRSAILLKANSWIYYEGLSFGGVSPYMDEVPLFGPNKVKGEKEYLILRYGYSE